MMNSYYSPFPREKSNNEVLKKSYATCYDGKRTFIEIPPTVTATYMKKNPFYFDLKKSNKVKTRTNQTKSKSQRYTLFDNKRLDNILNSNKEKYIIERPKLDPGCEEILPKEKNKTITAKTMREITPAEALKILNKINYPNPEQYGKVPKYINEFKVRDFIEKEYERLVEEEKHYPRGTFKVWEKDRIFILNNLYLIKEDLMKQLCAFPVNYYLRSIKIRQARSLVEKKLDEVDFAIRIFELTNVFLQN